MRASISTKSALGLVAAVLLLVPRAAAPSAPVLERAEVNDELTVLNLSGHFGEGMPTITVGGKKVQPLTNDGTYVSAKLYRGFKAGTYVVTATTPDGRSGSLTAVLDPKASGGGDTTTPSPKPVLESATPNEERTVLNLTGNFGSGMPVLSLDDQALRPLMNDGTFIAARLPRKISPGKYLVLVKTTDGRSGALQVTIR